MVNLITKTLREELLAELGKESTLYTDNYVENIVESRLNEKLPNKTIYITEDDSAPVNYEIHGTHYPSTWLHKVQLTIVTRGFDSTKCKELRRTLTKRTEISLMKKKGSLFTSLVNLVDSGVGYLERVSEYKIGGIVYDDEAMNNEFVYASRFDLLVTTETDFI